MAPWRVLVASLVPVVFILSPAGADVVDDKSYGTGGKAVVKPGCNDHLVESSPLPDGRVLALEVCYEAHTKVLIHALDETGAPDLRYGDNGIATVQTGTDLDPPGGDRLPRCVSAGCEVRWTADAAGSYLSVQYVDHFDRRGNGATVHVIISRLDASGHQDDTFGIGGHVRLEARTASQSLSQDVRLLTKHSGELLVYVSTGVRKASIWNVTTAGTLKGSFGKRGLLKYQSADPRYVLPGSNDDTLYVVGETQYKDGPNWVATATDVRKYTARGRPDHSFGGDGRVLVRHSDLGGSRYRDVFVAPVLTPDGRMVLTVADQEYRWIDWYRLTRSGRLDQKFAARTLRIRQGSGEPLVLGPTPSIAGGKVAAIWEGSARKGVQYVTILKADGSSQTDACPDCVEGVRDRPYIMSSARTRDNRSLIITRATIRHK